MKTVRLHEVAEVKLGRQRSPKNHAGDSMRPYLRAANVGWSGLLLDDLKWMNFTDDEMDTFRLKPGDLLLNEGSGSPREVGKPALWSGEIGDCAFQNTLLRVRPDPGLDSRYLLHYFAWQAGIGSFARGSRGVGIRHLGREALAAWPTPLPTSQQQLRIVAILDRANVVRAERRQVLGNLNALERSTFLDMFASETAGAVVQEVATLVRTGPFGSQLLHGEFVADGVAVLGLDNVVGNEFRWVERRYITPAKYEQLKRYTVHPGDVLISIMGTTGRCVVVPDDIPTAINTKHICAITVDRDRLDPIFLRACFLWHAASRAHLRRQTKGSIMDGLNMGIIKAMPVPAPPLHRQREFAARVEQVSRQRASVQRALAADDELFASLQSRAFRGEL